MTAPIYAFIAVLGGAACLFASSPSLRAAAYAGLMAALLAVWWTALGHPRPILFGVPKGTVMAFALNQPQSIDVLVKPGLNATPVLYALPWSEGDAEALIKADRTAKRQARPLEMRGTHRVGVAGYRDQRRAALLFYPAPAPQLPPKQRP